jgi:hypothetical protein
LRNFSGHENAEDESAAGRGGRRWPPPISRRATLWTESEGSRRGGLRQGGAQTGGEPRAAPRGGDAEAHAQAWLVVVFHGLALTLSGRGGSQWRLVGGRASGGRGGQDSGARALGLWERTRHGRCGKQNCRRV